MDLRSSKIPSPHHRVAIAATANELSGERGVEMPLSEEASRRFGAYVTHTEPSNITPTAESELFDFVGWALAREPEALSEKFAYERIMSEQGFTSNKMTYVQTVIVSAQPLRRAYERARCGSHVALNT
jgi:hypothetical protein